MTTTVKLLSTYNNFGPRTILDLPDDIAAKLLLGGIGATTDLTGGTRGYQEAPFVGSTPAPTLPPARAVNAGQRYTMTVPAGVTVVLTGSSDVSGTREVLTSSGAVAGSTPLQAGSTLTAGPYSVDTSVRLVVNAGTVATSVRAATSGQAAPDLGPSITVPAGSTDFVLKTAGNGAIGDTIVLIRFTNTGTATTVTLTDGDGTAYPDPSGNPGLITNPFNAKVIQGASASTSAPPDYTLPNQPSFNGPWKVTTGANVSLQVFGNFT